MPTHEEIFSVVIQEQESILHHRGHLTGSCENAINVAQNLNGCVYRTHDDSYFGPEHK